MVGRACCAVALLAALTASNATTETLFNKCEDITATSLEFTFFSLAIWGDAGPEIK